MITHKQDGVTLLEILLVLLIGAVIITMSIQRFQKYRINQEVEQVKINVDLLFQGMGYLYQADCRNKNIFNRNNNPNVIDLQNHHQFFSQWPLPPTSIIDNSTNTGYLAQFNLVLPGLTRNIRECYSLNTPSCSAPEEIPLKHSIQIWRIQIAVKLMDATKAKQYQAALGADCISSIRSNLSVYSCEDTHRPVIGDYLVWERVPSFASQRTSSGLLPMMFVLKQFNQQYYNDDNYAFNVDDPIYNNGDHGTHGTDYENYLCGG